MLGGLFSVSEPHQPEKLQKLVHRPYHTVQACRTTAVEAWVDVVRTACRVREKLRDASAPRRFGSFELCTCLVCIDHILAFPSNLRNTLPLAQQLDTLLCLTNHVAF